MDDLREAIARIIERRFDDGGAFYSQWARECADEIVELPDIASPPAGKFRCDICGAKTSHLECTQCAAMFVSRVKAIDAAP